MDTGVAFLMYHELQLPGRELCQSDPGYTRYIVSASAFENQIRSLRSLGYQGIDVRQALENSGPKKVVITFDDGCETDLEDRKSTRLNSSHSSISYAVFC